MQRSYLLAAFGLSALIFCCASRAQATAPFTVVNYYNQATPGIPGSVFAGFDFPLIDEAGKVTYQGSYHAIGSNIFRTAIWSGTPGNMQVIAKEGDAAPGAGTGVTFGPPSQSSTAFAGFTIAPTTSLDFQAHLTGTSVTTSNNTGIWTESTGQPQLLARTGSPAPGLLSGATFTGFNSFPVNSSGQVALQAIVAGTGVTSDTNSGLWFGTAGSLQLIARSGDQAPGVSTGTTFGYIIGGGSPFYYPAINDAGAIAFTGSLTGTGTTSSNNTGIWAGAPNALQLVVRSGDTIPGSSGAKFGALHSSHNNYSEPVLDQNGVIYFRADLVGTGTTTANRYGLFAASNGTTRIVARSGDPVPGVPGATYGSPVTGAYFSQPSVAGAGQMAFQAGLVGPGGAGIFSGTEGSIHLVTQSGNHAPGTPAGVVFGAGTGVTSPFDDPVDNALGEVAFVSQLTGTGINSTNREGLWATDPAGNLSLLFRTGDQIDPGSGILHTINGINFVNDQLAPTTNVSGLNDLGQLVVMLSFTDNTQSVVVVALPVPEPSSFALMFVGFGGLLSLVYLRRARNP